jgi:catechol 2,3-dioxygenase-like lactoylglutathione lyase family enzyme
MDDNRPVLDQLNIVVGDMPAATDFYRRLGLRIEDWHPQWDAHHRSAKVDSGLDLDLDSTRFAQRWCGGWAAGRRGVVIGFRVGSRPEVDRLYGELTRAGYRGLQAPHDAFWGARYAVIEDPEGNAVGLMSPADDGHRSAPPDPSAIG